MEVQYGIGIAPISQVKISAPLFLHEIWNSLHFSYIYQDNDFPPWNMEFSIFPISKLGANAPSWKLDFGIVHIWRSEWRFSYKKYGNLYILYEKSGSSCTATCSLFAFVSLSLTRVCLCCMCVCVCVCVCVRMGPAHCRHRDEGDITSCDDEIVLRCGATRRGRRRSQTRGDWSMHLCDAPVQDRNEERMTGDSSGQGLFKFAVTSRGITKLTISAVLCVCISKQWWGVLRSHPEEINQVM